MSSTERLIIKTVTRPSKDGEDALLEWFCDVFDLAGRNNVIEPEMLRRIAEESINGQGVTSMELKRKLEIPRSTVIYHLNRFIYSGLVIRKGRKYCLRSKDMAGTIEELQADMLREFGRLMEFAQRLDAIMEDDSNGGRQKGRRERKS